MRDYKKIKAFQSADNLTLEIYNATKFFPKDECYGLTSQFRRATTSIPANIVEGASRQHKKDYLHFLYISRGSLSETEYLLHLSNKLGYLSDDKYKDINNLLQETAKTLYGLINSVKRETGFIAKIIALITSSFVLYGLNFTKYL